MFELCGFLSVPAEKNYTQIHKVVNKWTFCHVLQAASCMPLASRCQSRLDTFRYFDHTMHWKFAQACSAATYSYLNNIWPTGRILLSRQSNWIWKLLELQLKNFKSCSSWNGTLRKWHTNTESIVVASRSTESVAVRLQMNETVAKTVAETKRKTVAETNMEKCACCWENKEAESA